MFKLILQMAARRWIRQSRLLSFAGSPFTSVLVNLPHSTLGKPKTCDMLGI